jgi:hypothetical protein
MRCSCIYTAGFPLDVVKKAGRMMEKQLQLYKVESIYVTFKPFRFTVLQLMGTSDESIDWKEVENVPTTKLDASETFRWVWFYWSRMQLAFYFGKLKIAESMIERFRSISAIDTSYIVTSMRVFFSGLTLSGLARRSKKKRKYTVRARKAAMDMKKMMKTRGLNNLHRYIF